jgi:hypothetical protein
MNTPFPCGPHAEKCLQLVGSKNYADRPGLPAKVVRPAQRLNPGLGGCPAHFPSGLLLENGLWEQRVDPFDAVHGLGDDQVHRGAH